MTKFIYEQSALTDIPVGSRFLERIFGAMEKRRFYVVVKHFIGWRMTSDENGVRSRSDENIPKTKVKYISGYDPNGVAIWAESI